jgi:hypothetical protein
LPGRIIEFSMYLGDFRKGHDEEKAITVHRDSIAYLAGKITHFEKKAYQNIDVNGFFECNRNTPYFAGPA